MEVRVLFEGTLDKCTYEHGKKDWKRRHFVFKHILASNIRSLELYAAGTKNWRKTEPKGVLALYPGYEILKIHEPKRPFAFEIKTVDHAYRLAAHSEDELNQWILILERESIVNSFCVEPEINDQMAKLGAVDICHLHIANSELRLLCAKDGRLLVAWPFTCLRRYMSTRGKFTVEAGRRAPTGEGKFTFLTPQHDEIYKLLDKVVKSRAGQIQSTASSHESLRKTQSVPIAAASVSKDDSQNGYDHLVSSASVSSSTADDQLSPGMTNSMKNTYSAPYGHLPSRDVTQTGTPLASQGLPQILPGGRLSAESKVGGQYDTLTQPVQDALNQPVQGKQGVGEDGYNTLNQHVLSAQEYNVLNRGPKLQATLRQPETEDVYNVIGETLHPVAIPDGYQVNEDGYHTLSTSRSNASAPEETYNTLDHGSPARSTHKASHRPGNTESQGSVTPVPKPTARRLFGPNDKHSSSVAEVDDIQSKAKPPPPPARKKPEHAMLQKSQSVDEGSELYHSLEMSKARPPAPNRRTSEQLRKLQKSQSLMVDENDDMYNTLDTCTSKVTHSPVQPRKIHGHINKQTSVDSEKMYNSLDATRVSTPPIPAWQKHSSSSNEGDDMYNTLGTKRVGPTLHNEKEDDLMASHLPRNDDDMYNTLDKSRTQHSLSVPVPAQRSFLSHGGTSSPLSSPCNRDSPELKRSSTSTMQSVRCPLHVDTSPSLAKTNRQASSLDNLDSYASTDASSTLEMTHQQSTSFDDLDSYARIDYVTLSPAKGTVKQPPIPKQRSSPSKERKTSAPDILSLAGYHGGKEFKKPGKSGLVSNLKASLEAGGLDLTKLPRKPKKLSREGSEELPTYAEVDERGASHTIADDVFVAVTPPTRPARSQSSPSDAKPGDDIYAELDQTAQVRPKSLQITKAKKNTKK